MTSEKSIWIITSEENESVIEKNGSSKGFFDDDPQTDEDQDINSSSLVPVSTLRDNLAQLLNNIDESLAQINQQEAKSGFEIDEIELSVGINGKGKVGLWAVSAEAGSNASMKLKLKRKKLDQ